MTTFKKLAALLIAGVMVTAMGSGVLATDVDILNTEYTTISLDGQEYQISNADDGTVVEVCLYDLSGLLLQKSTVNRDSRLVIQNIYNNKQRSVPESTVYNLDEMLYDDTSAIREAAAAQPAPMSLSARSVMDEPFPTDDGLSSSSIFSGYKIIGSMTNDGYTATLNRTQNRTVGVSKRFDVSIGATTATAVGVLLSLFGGAGMVARIAISLLNSLMGAVAVTAFSTSVGYYTYHYTYKTNVNGSGSYSYKNCRALDYWFIIDPITRTDNMEERGRSTGSHSGELNNTEYARFAIDNYRNGQVTNVGCSQSAG